MVFYRRRYKRRFRTRRPRAYVSNGAAFATGSGPRKYRSQPYGLVRGHVPKYHVHEGTSGTNSGYDLMHYEVLTDFAIQGAAATVDARDSNLVRPLECVIRCNLTWDESKDCTMFRVIILQWFADNAVFTPYTAGSPVRVVDTTVGSADGYMLSPMDAGDMAAHGRILFDEIFSPPVVRDTAATSHHQTFEIVINKFPRAIRCHSASAFGSGHIYMICWSHHVTGDLDAPVLRYVARTKYIDF